MRALMFASALATALTLPGAAQAAGNGCDFAPPSPALQAHAYPAQTFVRKKNNAASEAAQIGKAVRIEILHSQCVDTLVTEYTLVLPRPAGPEHALNDWLDFAADELGRLKISPVLRDMPGLLAFLKNARALQPRDGKLAACKDGTQPEGSVCDWESQGGYIFKVNSSRNAVRITITDYASG